MPTICLHIPTNDVSVRQEFHTNTNAEARVAIDMQSTLKRSKT